MAASIAAKTCAGVMPAVMLIAALPLMVSEPALTTAGASTAVPVTFAGASGDNAAPMPVIFAAEGGPASGLAMKFAGLSSSEPGMSVSAPLVSG